jgi:transposase
VEHFGDQVEVMHWLDLYKSSHLAAWVVRRPWWGIVERLVPDELWELFQRVVPEAPVRPQGGGRRRHGDREVLAAIVFVATSGCTWQQLPSASFGPSGATAHRRFAEWTKGRVWAKLHRLVLDELGSRGELDWSRCAIDSVNRRALKRGGLDGSESCRRTYGWLMLHRRLARDYETLPAHSEAMIHLAMTDLMARRLTGENTISWRDPAKPHQPQIPG